MKYFKKAIFIFLFLQISFLIYSDNNKDIAALFNNMEIRTNLGEYVIYHDTRGNTDAVTSIGLLEDNEYLVNRKNNKRNYSFTIIIKIENNEMKNYEITNGEIKDPMDLIILADIVNMIIQRQGVEFYSLTEAAVLEDRWPAYTLYHHYNQWIPIFNLKGTYYKNDTEPAIKLIRAGILETVDEPVFYNFEVPEQAVDSPDYKIRKGDIEDKNINNLVSLPLDDNWQMDEETYVINKETDQDAFIYAEDIDLNQFGINAMELLKSIIFYQPDFVDPYSIAFEYTEDYLVVSYTMFDSSTEAYKKVAISVLPTDAENTYIFVFLESYLSLYDKNEKYFRKIIF